MEPIHYGKQGKMYTDSGWDSNVAISNIIFLKFLWKFAYILYFSLWHATALMFK